MSDALVPPLRRPGPPHAGFVRLANEAPPPPGYARPRPEAVLLLSQVLARMPGVDVPVVQFVQVTADDSGGPIVKAFAEACVARLGRTLLATVPDHRGRAGAPMRPDEPTSRDSRLHARTFCADAPDIVPDAVLPGLYHARFGCEMVDAFAMARGPDSARLEHAKPDFRMLVIDCAPIRHCAAALDFAARCHGTVLSVAAGCSPLAEIQAAARQVQLAGGTLIGSVLYDVLEAPVERSVLRRVRR